MDYQMLKNWLYDDDWSRVNRYVQLKYDGKYTKVDILVVWGTVDKKRGLGQLILFESQNIGLDW